MADYVSPEARRRIAGGLMAAQYDRATPEEGNVAQRHGLLPLATYDNGRTGLAFPGFVADPVQSFNRLLQNGYTSGDTQGVEDAFNVAGAAMMGGLAAPKPRMSAPPTNTITGYRGSATNGRNYMNGDEVWASSSPAVASEYAMNPWFRMGRDASSDVPNVTPMEFRFKNPQEINARGKSYTDIDMPEDIARRAREAGHDGLVIRNIVDPPANGIPVLPGSMAPQTTIAALQRGTVYSPLTGDLLFANGGRPGATAGAALGAIPDAAALDMSHAARMQRAREMGFDTATNWFHGSKRNDLSEITPGTKEPGAWFTTEKKIAADYARGEDAAIYETYLKTKNPFVVQMDPASPDIFAPMHNGSRIDFDNNVDIVKHAFRNGYDGVHFPDGNFSEYGNTMVVARPNQIRSKDAAFNPAKADSANLLYANGGRPGATAGAALGGVDLQDPALAEILRKYGLDVPSRPASPQYRPGDA